MPDNNTNRYSRLLLRRGTKSELESENPILEEGEPIFEKDTGRLKIGDGVSTYINLNYIGSNNSNN